jgi:hypothetical protein
VLVDADCGHRVEPGRIVDQTLLPSARIAVFADATPDATQDTVRWSTTMPASAHPSPERALFGDGVRAPPS